jgi:hypothetical protein
VNVRGGVVVDIAAYDLITRNYVGFVSSIASAVAAIGDIDRI